VTIYTRRGDGGETDLFAGGRVAKDDLRVDTLGVVDELNAFVGICAATTEHADLRRIAHAMQGRLLDLGATLATPDPQRRAESGVGEPTEEDVEELEAHIDALESELPRLKRFILPGGTPAAAALHAARTVCRRAERRVIALRREAPLGAASLRYLNRLSDLLFVMARVENHRGGVDDIKWEGRRR
jgi:cob(I)alamin adenosyltransferase